MADAASWATHAGDVVSIGLALAGYALLRAAPAGLRERFGALSVWAGRSASLAVTVVTAVLFSATLTAAFAPPPSLVMTGVLSLTGVTVTAIVCMSVRLPSLTCTMTS